MKQKPSVSISPARWLAYATAGAASGLISAPCAEGRIHYSGYIDQRFRGYEGRSFPLADGAAIGFAHFPKRTYSGGSTSTFFPGAAFVSVVGGSLAGYQTTCVHTSNFAIASRLIEGASVAKHRFVAKPGVLIGTGTTSSCGDGGGERGKFGYGSGYVGFRFNGKHGLQYGWARIHVHDSQTARFRVLDYAYADPGETILAGQKKEKKDPLTGKEESLGALALGATGLIAWRKRRAKRDNPKNIAAA